MINQLRRSHLLVCLYMYCMTQSNGCDAESQVVPAGLKGYTWWPGKCNLEWQATGAYLGSNPDVKEKHSFTSQLSECAGSCSGDRNCTSFGFTYNENGIPVCTLSGIICNMAQSAYPFFSTQYAFGLYFLKDYHHWKAHEDFQQRPFFAECDFSYNDFEQINESFVVAQNSLCCGSLDGCLNGGLYRQPQAVQSEAECATLCMADYLCRSFVLTTEQPAMCHVMYTACSGNDTLAQRRGFSTFIRVGKTNYFDASKAVRKMHTYDELKKDRSLLGKLEKWMRQPVYNAKQATSKIKTSPSERPPKHVLSCSTIKREERVFN